MKLNQKGFTHVEIFLVLIVITLIAAAGWLVWDRQNMTPANLNTVGNDTRPLDKNTDKAQEITIKEVPAAETNTSGITDKPTIKYAYINGVSFPVPNELTDLLTWALTSEGTNLSSQTLLNKEKELYGDNTLFCKAQDYPLGRVYIKDDSNPYPGNVLVKKLKSGKYLFIDSFQVPNNSNCDQRSQLKDLRSELMNKLKTALNQAE